MNTNQAQTAAALQKSLPFLPGHQFSLQVSPFLTFQHLSNHRKSHAFDYTNKVSTYNKEAPGIGGTTLTGQEEDKIFTSIQVYPHNSTGERVPSWVAFDRKVLRFYAYFQEAVQERREEQYRVRRYVDNVFNL
jgi:hypothetical protein